MENLFPPRNFDPTKKIKIENTELNQSHIGYRVIYIPLHAQGDVTHKDCEYGTISSWNDMYVFVNYGTGTNQATNPNDLIWESWLTPVN